MSDPTHADRILDAASSYDGWPLIEIYGVGPDGTCQCPRAKNCTSAGKHPRGEQWQVPADIDIPEILGRRPRANLGVLTGEPAGFWVLDIDQPGLGAMQELVRQHGDLPATRVHRTGGGTYHYFFSMPDFDVTNRRGRLPAGIDARGTGGQVVLPPSRSSKGYYEVVTAADIADTPDWLLDLIRPTDMAVLDDIVKYDSGGDLPPGTNQVTNTTGKPIPVESAYETTIIDGERARLRRMRELATPDGEGYTGEPWDETTYKVACQLFELANAAWSALSPEEVPALVAADAPTDAGFTLANVNEKIQSAKRTVGDKARPDTRGQSNTSWVDMVPRAKDDGPLRFPAAPVEHPKRGLDDIGNAQRLVDRHGDEIRWASDADGWLSYDGKRWSESHGMTHLKRHVIATFDAARNDERDLHSPVVDEFYANGTDKSSPRDRFDGWMAKSRFDARIKATLSVAQADARIECSMADFDRDKNLLNVSNGIVDLRDGSKVPHDPTMMLKSFADVEYDPLATCPLFDAFLERVQPDPGMRGYLQTVAGYSITGETTEQALFLHNGHGSNGKSVFLEIIRDIVGNMGQKMARDTIMSKNGQASGIPDDLAAMLGGRFLVGSETAAGKKLDDERIKELVGGEAQRARHLYGKWFDFYPTGKIHIATNHLPMMESGGHGIGRRLRIIPWEVTIPDAEQDKTLKDKILANEASGVLAWLVRGAIEWYARGLRTPDFVSERTAEHVEEADPLWPFIREKLIIDEEGSETETLHVYHAYETWASAQNIKPMSGKVFTPAMRERLGHDIQYRARDAGRRSMMRVRVRLEAVPAAHQQFFTGRA